MKLRKIVAAMLASVMAVSIMTGCGYSSASGDASKSSSDSLNVIVWDGTWSEDMFKDFTKETGVKVNISYITNTDELLTKLINGSVSYDIIDLESAYVNTFVQNNLLTKIDHDKIPNESNINEEYMKEGCIGDEDFTYTIPVTPPGYTAVVYNKETCPIKITSFKDLANPKLKGRVALVDSTISLYGAALESLGYKADSTNEDEIKEANDLLMKIKENTKAFVGETAVPQLENGDVDVALGWDYPILCGDSKENWDKFGYAILDGGVERTSLTWAIPSSSKNKENAEKLMNFMLEPKEYVKNIEAYPGNKPLLKKDLVKDYLSEDYFDNPAISNMDKDLLATSWEASISDEQISIMDTYYTQLKGE